MLSVPLYVSTRLIDAVMENDVVRVGGRVIVMEGDDVWLISSVMEVERVSESEGDSD